MAAERQEPTKDDPLAAAILELLQAQGAEGSVSPMDVARVYAAGRARRADPPDLWRRYLRAVRQQAIHLARQGRIEIVRKGAPVDPNDFKGVVRLRLPRG